jgi:hypothetical protein
MVAANGLIGNGNPQRVRCVCPTASSQHAPPPGATDQWASAVHIHTRTSPPAHVAVHRFTPRPTLSARCASHALSP